MNGNNQFVRFDWAIRNLLRIKANLVVLEGLLSVFLNEKFYIKEILEEDDNIQCAEYNRITAIAFNHNQEAVLIEIQCIRELYYIERIRFGEAKPIGMNPLSIDIKKCYTICLLHFNLFEGSDFLYRGINHLFGVYTGEKLNINNKQQKTYKSRIPFDLPIEYVLINTNHCKEITDSKTAEWIYFFKSGIIHKNTTVPGLIEAKDCLCYYHLSKKECHNYNEYINAIMIQNDVLDTAKMEGRALGWAEDKAEGRTESIRTIAKKLKEMGMPTIQIEKATGLSITEIEML